METRWIIDPPSPMAERVAAFLDVSPVIGQLIVNRGIVIPQKAAEYLDPSLARLHPPMLMPNAELAAERIKRAILNKEKIMIYGDYDVDGITASATMYHGLKHFGANVDCYIPHRVSEGYGLNDIAVEKIIADGVKLIVTVDCGITAVGPAKVAKDAGVDMIITDHHEWQDAFPDCYAIVHPRLPGFSPAYPNPHLCGAGVAFKVMWAVGQAFSGESRVAPSFRKPLMDLLCFTALGTIADVVPLQEENRVIAHNGLSMLPTCPFPGIAALISSAGLGSRAIDGYAVGFTLAPRLNAAGRMGHALEALRMLLSDDFDAALVVAKSLDAANKERQATERAIAKSAIEEAELFPFAKVHVVAGRDWHPGVVGIVASRLVERFHRPALVLVDDGEHVHGSGRSVDGFNLAEALGACKTWLVKYGGHAMAAGVKMKRECLEPFRLAMNYYADDHLDPELLKPKIDIDCTVTLGDLTTDFVTAVNRMGPFGQANRRPLFMIQGAVLSDPKTMGKENQHLTYRVKQGGVDLKALAFGKAQEAHKIPFDKAVDLVVEPTLNEFRGETSVELFVRAIR